MSEQTVILGIDPGLDRTGYGVIEWAGGGRFALREGGVIRTSSSEPLAARVGRIHEQLAELLDEFRPAHLAVEQLYAHYKHPRTAILMGHARGAILLACAQAGVGVRDMPATLVKRSLCGNGHASKEQVQRSIQALCRLRELPQPPDVADALAMALCAGRSAAIY